MQSLSHHILCVKYNTNIRTLESVKNRQGNRVPFLSGYTVSQWLPFS